MSFSPASLEEQVFHMNSKEPVAGLGWLGNTAIFALGDGRVLGITGDIVTESILHKDASILVAKGDKNGFLTGGDDGYVVRTRRISEDLSSFEFETVGGVAGKWIDALATHPDGSFAFSAGKHVTARDSKGHENSWEAPSSVRGLAFSPKGYRLALSHYNGVSLWFPNTTASPEFLPWKGSHLDVTWSPDARFVVSSMQENALHGWRLLPDKGDMRMAGYPSKTRSFAWTVDKKWLATSGAEAVILWPFETKEGPMGHRPKECGVRPVRVSQVAAHPASPVLAAGYEDGAVYLFRLTEPGEIIVQRGGKEFGAICALGWDEEGRKLAFGCTQGNLGVLTLP